MSNEVTIEVKGLASLRKKLAALPDAADKAVMAGLFVGGLKVEADAKESLRHSGTGRTYKRRGITHQASSPGQPPSSDTGNLLNSIHTVVNAAADTVEVRAGGGSSQVKYAAMLEFGTANMAERPFMRPALFTNKGFIQESVEKKVAKALADGTR